jgi:CHAT domain-containing protein
VFWRAFAEAGGLSPLPESEREARGVAALAPGSTLRLRGAASESFVKSAELAQYSLIHIAAHAVVSDDDLGGAAMALAPDAQADGYLTAADLAGLDLAAELVVLSGCRTAQGVVVRGEGIQGLTAPLLRAGARAVLATSWKVRDADAARFVERFYRGVAADGRAAPALRRAKLEARGAGVPGSVWAGFVLTGDPGAGFAVPRSSVKALR